MSQERLKLESSNFVWIAGYVNVSLDRMVDHPWKGRGTGHVIHFEFYSIFTPPPLLNFSGIAEDRIVNFCARPGWLKKY